MIKLREKIFFYYPRNNKSKIPSQTRLTIRDAIFDNFETVEELFQKDYITVFRSMVYTANFLPYRYYFKEADCQLHGKNGTVLFNKSLSILLIYALVCSFLDPEKKGPTHAHIYVSMCHVNRLFAKTSKQYFKMQKPSLEQLTSKFTYCVPYLQSGLDEYNYSVEYVRRTCLENAETWWLSHALINGQYEKYNLIFVDKDKVEILLIDEIELTEKDESKAENEESEDEEIYFNCNVTRLTNTWPSALRDLILEYEEEGDRVRLNDGEFSSLLSNWLKENPLNSIIVIQPPDIDNITSGNEKNQIDEKWRKGTWLWNLIFWRRPHPDPTKKEQYCYAVNLFEPTHQRKKKRKKGVQTT